MLQLRNLCMPNLRKLAVATAASHHKSGKSFLPRRGGESSVDFSQALASSNSTLAIYSTGVKLGTNCLPSPAHMDHPSQDVLRAGQAVNLGMDAVAFLERLR